MKAVSKNFSFSKKKKKERKKERKIKIGGLLERYVQNFKLRMAGYFKCEKKWKLHDKKADKERAVLSMNTKN